MGNASKKNQNKIERNQDYQKLEARIARIESYLNLKPIGEQDNQNVTKFLPENISEATDNLEFRIGQFWFAKAGIIALAIGIVFLLTLPYKNLPAALPSIIGYLIVTSILTLSYVWRKSYEFLSRYLLGGSLLLLYFATMRLHFFSSEPAIQNHTIFVSLLLLCVIFAIFISIRIRSVYLTGLSITLGYFTTLISESPLPLFLLLIFFSLISTYLKLKCEWNGTYILGIILAYFAHFLWFIGNPIMGHSLQLKVSPLFNVLFIPVYAIIFAQGNLFRNKNIPENNTVILTTFLNCFGCYGLFLLITVTKFNQYLFFQHISLSIIFLSLSIIFWIKERSKFSTFFYSILAYIALSVSIIAEYKIPDSFILLCWQSLLVISTALWFRSKIIVLANFLIFIIIFLSYLTLVSKAGPISLSFGIVALISARITNWQRHRLELKTEFMRNAYLTSAFFSIPYGLYHSVPKPYVSLAWIGVALFYYIVSIILKNKKYRWMALMTLIITLIYILIIGIIQLTPVFRIISFLVLGLVLLTISVLYTRQKMKKSEEREQNS